MMLNPRHGQHVQVWYGKGWRRAGMPLHGRVGVVRVVCRARPRNHGVEIDGQVYGVPCGNLRKLQETHHEQ